MLVLFADERINSVHIRNINGGQELIALIQRVSEASVTIQNEVVGEIGCGLLALIAVQPRDGTAGARDAERLAARVLTYRVFSDTNGRMNRSLLEQEFELLAVPQFTLAADTRKGARPSFSGAAPPDMARECFEQFLRACREQLPAVACGHFGADMQVSLVNDGPVTFWLET